MNTIKSWLLGALCAFNLFLVAGGAALAQDQTYTGETISASDVVPVVSSTGLAAAISQAIGPYVKVGFVVGLGVFVVWLGWRFIRKFIGR